MLVPSPYAVTLVAPGGVQRVRLSAQRLTSPRAALQATSRYTLGMLGELLTFVQCRSHREISHVPRGIASQVSKRGGRW